MNKKIKLATVFSGIGAIEFALKRLNIDYEVEFACDNGERLIEYDKEEQLKKVKSLGSIREKKEYIEDLYASQTRKTNFVEKSYMANYGDKLKDKNYFQDICLLDGVDFSGKVDLLVGGSPCQTFSTVGSQEGLEDTRGTLFYDYARLINEIKPKVFIFENVRGLLTHDKGRTWGIIYKVLNNLGYDIHFDLLNSSNFGIPQTRRRLFVVGLHRRVKFQFSQKLNKVSNYTMKDFTIERNAFGSITFDKDGNIVLGNIPGKIDDKYFLTEKLYNYVMKGGTKTFYQKPEIDLPIARTILSTMGNRHRAGIDNYLTVDGKVRMLSEREAHRLMGFTDDYKIVVSRAQGYKQAGNSIVVDVLMSIMRDVLKTKVLNN